MANFRLPNINTMDPAGQMNQMTAYMRELVKELQIEFDAMDKEREEAGSGDAAEPFSVIQCYPVGSVYISVDKTSPKTLFGGKWEQIMDRFLLAAGDSFPAGSLGGEEKHRLTPEEMPIHQHQASNHGHGESVYVNKGTAVEAAGILTGGSGSTGDAGGGLAHNNMPPYVAVYVWKRIA